MGRYSVMEEIRKMRLTGTIVKNIKGCYYVYEYTPTSVKVELPDGTAKWKSKTVIGPCIGQITMADGFIRNDAKLADSDTTVFEFGCYFLIKELAAKTMDRLKEFFNPQETLQIALKEKGLSVKDTMFMIKGLKIIKERNRYVVRNDNKQRKQLCEKIGLNLSKHEVMDAPT